MRKLFSTDTTVERGKRIKISDWRDMKNWRIRVVVLACILVAVSAGGLHLMDNRTIIGTIVKEYAGGYAQPKIATYADGHYYTLDNGYGSSIYDFNMGNRPDDREFLFRTQYEEIVDIAAEGKWLVWGGARDYKERYVVYKAYDVESEQTTVLKKLNTENVKAYPFIALSHGKAFFVECVYPEKQIIIWQHDLESGQEKEIYRFDSYEQYKPLIETAGDYLYAPVAMTDGRVRLVEYNIVTGEDRMILLPEQIDVLFALDYDVESETFALYYRDESKRDETISLYKETTERLKKIGSINTRQRMERDKLRFWNGNVLWIEYNRPKVELAEILCRRKLQIYNLKKGARFTFDKERVTDYFFDENNLYCVSVEDDTTHLLNHIDSQTINNDDS